MSKFYSETNKLLVAIFGFYTFGWAWTWFYVAAFAAIIARKGWWMGTSDARNPNVTRPNDIVPVYATPAACAVLTAILSGIIYMYA